MRIDVTHIVAGLNPIVTNFDVDDFHVSPGGVLTLVINGKSDCVFSPAGWYSLYIKEMD